MGAQTGFRGFRSGVCEFTDKLTSLVGASLRAGGAGAGGAAAACSLQGSVQVHVGPPQVRVATVTQTQRCLRHDCEQIPTPTFPPVELRIPGPYEVSAGPRAEAWPVSGRVLPDQSRRDGGRPLRNLETQNSSRF